MIWLLIIILVLIAIVLLAIGIYYLRYLIPLRPKENGFEYVYVKEGGTVRELYDDEIEYLKEEFVMGDGNRPYIKSRYKSVTPVDNDISGFILRNRVPKKVQIKKVDQKDINRTEHKVDRTGAWGVFSKSQKF